MAKYLKSDYYSCSCSSPEHVVTFTWWHKDDDALNMNIHLAKHPFYKRVVNAIKYVFGYSCQYGHFDEFFKKEELDLINNKKNCQTGEFYYEL